MDNALVDETVTLTQELIRIRSENPGGTEAGMADRTEDYLKNLGLDVERDDVVDGRQNIIAKLSANPDAPTLVYLNHMDTVPAGDGWTKDPFSAEISEGKLWGRGSCDMKGGLAASLIAIKNLKMKLDGGARLNRSIRACLVVDEECSWMQGVSKAVELGRIKKEDIVIACEPTSLELKTAQKGALWYEIVFSGKSAHAAAPQMGANAIQAAAQTLIRLEEAAASMSNTNELLGKTTIVTSVIDGGSKTNIVPDACRIEVDVRFVPPLSVTGVRELLEGIATEACQSVPGTSAQINSLSVDRPPILSSLQTDNAKIFCRAISESTGVNPVPAGVSYYSDAGLAAARTGNQQCYLLGPGSIEQAHRTDEFIDLEELKKSALIISSLTEQFALGK